MDDTAPIVFVVDDDPAVREALTNLIRSVGWKVSAFASASEFLSSLRPEQPCCLVLDVRLPGVSGLDLQGELRKTGEAIPIVFIAGQADIPMTVRAMKAGAVEFLPKPFREQDLLEAIREAFERGAAACGERAERDSLRKRLALLTPREHEVMNALLTGMLNKQVAGALGISLITVKIHRRRIMDKMTASSLVELGRTMEKLSRDGASNDQSHP
jgi:FixJ family two-component response regulator